MKPFTVAVVMEFFSDLQKFVSRREMCTHVTQRGGVDGLRGKSTAYVVLPA